MQVIQLGSLVINMNILALLAGAAGSASLAWLLRRLGLDRKLGDKYTSAFIIGFFVWKASLFLFDPRSVIANPLSLLYFDGGDYGILLAGATALAYVAFRIYKERSPVTPNLQLALAGWVTGNAAYYAIYLIFATSNELYYAAMLLLHILSLSFLLRSNERQPILARLQALLLWYSIGMIAINMLDKQRFPLLASLSLLQLGCCVIFIAALTISKWDKQSKPGS